MQEQLSVIHEFLKEIMHVSGADALAETQARYEELLGDLDGDALKLWEDAILLGKELVYLKTGIDDEFGRGLMATLSEAEAAELEEAVRIIDGNLFSYHFQPIVDVSTGDIFSYEALMRPVSDVLKSPLDVIRYADLRNRLNDIERATFFNVLGIIDEGKTNFFGHKVFINSIPKTVLSAEDYHAVEELMTRHNGVAVVEITEQAELKEDDFKAFKERMERIGVQTAIDDYGTGYSNVQNLLRYMPDYVKIDRSLLSGMQDDPKKRHFVREIIEFCHSNGIQALAEGVETGEELRAVILLGADLIQGYYTARPQAEPLEAIPYDIRQEMKKYWHERQEGMASRIYVADCGEHIDMERLVRSGTISVVIGKDGDYSISGGPGFDAEIDIDIADNAKVELTVENLRLINRKKLACINLGKGSEVSLILKGDNKLGMGGICVPKGSKLTVKGAGALSLMLDADEYYGIGNDINSEHGEIVFEQSGLIKIESNGKVGICIGSGLGGGIDIRSGQYSIEINSERAVGIGSFNRESNILVRSCDVSIDMSGKKGVAMGSLVAPAKMEIYECSVKLYISGKEAVGLGTLTGDLAEVNIHDASVVMNIHNDRCSGIAALDGTTSLQINKASLRVYAKGETILPFGGFSADTDLSFVDADITAKVMSNVKLRDYLPPERAEVVFGRVRIVLNGFEYELVD